MNAEAISPTTLRIIIAVIGAVILVAIYLFGRPRQPGQGRRLLPRKRDDARIEPVLGDADADESASDAPATETPEQGELDVALKRELDRLGATMHADRRGSSDAKATPATPKPAPPSEPAAGRRPQEFPVDRIVTLFVSAPEGETFGGGDIVVAAEKAGLRFGAMHIFHRLVDGRPDAGPIFSMANMMKPGYFDMPRIGELRTPGVTFFATLPGPVSALDAWDAMLPAAQRIAELLGGVLLDEDHNTLGRQRVAGLREELRAWDRQHEGEPIRLPPRR
ncbi:MAG: cell division protein ZipA [Rhodanobacteraceae bacterium]|nr:MAG: cell division protein ZipA [Rhodanobacteraceae bacterium]